MSKIECLRCGDCCRLYYYGMIITKEELDLLPIKVRYTPNNNNKLRITEYMCPFLTPDITCSIYDIRPCQCRLYHCGRLSTKDKKLDSLLEIRKLMDNNSEYREYKTEMDEEAIRWGNAHGWHWRKIQKY